MTMTLYSLLDTHNGYAPPIPFTNDEIAKRYFLEMRKENITVKYSPQDFSIWSIGEFDSETGEIKATEKRCLERG